MHVLDFRWNVLGDERLAFGIDGMQGAGSLLRVRLFKRPPFHSHLLRNTNRSALYPRRRKLPWPAVATPLWAVLTSFRPFCLIERHSGEIPHGDDAFSGESRTARSRCLSRN